MDCSVNSLVSNPNTLQQSPFHPTKSDIYPFTSQPSSQECQNNFTNLHHKCQTTCLWCAWVNVTHGWNGDCCNLFWILNQSVHRINCPWHVIGSLTWNSDNKWLVKMTIPFLYTVSSFRGRARASEWNPFLFVCVCLPALSVSSHLHLHGASWLYHSVHCPPPPRHLHYSL